MELGLLHARSIRKSEEHPALVGYSCRTCPCEGGCGDLSLWHPVWLLFTHIPLTDMGLHVFVGTIQAPGHSPVWAIACFTPPSQKGTLLKGSFTQGPSFYSESLVGFAFPSLVPPVTLPGFAQNTKVKITGNSKARDHLSCSLGQSLCLHNIRTSYS